MSVQSTCRVEVNREECTGCGFCLDSCKRNALKMSAVVNRFGVYPVQQAIESCQGCGSCYYLCPEPGAIVRSELVSA